MAPLEAINMKKLNMVTKVKNTDQKAKWQFFSLDSPFLKFAYQVAHSAWADQDERPKKMPRREGPRLVVKDDKNLRS